MRERQCMPIGEPAEDVSIIRQLSDQPVVRGQESDGIDLVCGECHAVVLLENVAAGSVFDLGIICVGCGTLNLTPARPPDHPLPIRRTHCLTQPSCEWIETLILEPGWCLVGYHTSEQIRQEAGRPPDRPYRFEEPADVSRLTDDYRQLLGMVFDKLEKKDRLTKAQGPAHEQYRHPLMRLVERARVQQRRLAHGLLINDLVALTQLGTIHGLYRQFLHLPVWNRMRGAAIDGHNFVHDVVTLAFIAHNLAQFNGISLVVREVFKERFADALIAAGPQSLLGVEVKTHHLLYDAKRVLTPEEADIVINKAFGSADTRQGGQLSDERPGFLLLGNLELSSKNREALIYAAGRKFHASAATRTHIYGLGLLWLSVSRDKPPSPYPLLDSLGVLYPQRESHFAATNFMYVENPHYTGHIHIRLRE